MRKASMNRRSSELARTLYRMISVYAALRTAGWLRAAFMAKPLSPHWPRDHSGCSVLEDARAPGSRLDRDGVSLHQPVRLTFDFRSVWHCCLPTLHLRARTDDHLRGAIVVGIWHLAASYLRTSSGAAYLDDVDREA